VALVFLRRDTIRPAPRRLVAATFVSGGLSTIPAGLISFAFIDESLVGVDATFTSIAAVMLLLVGPIEESSKFLAVRLFAFRSRYFDEPVDGLIFSAAASLGFASIENILYVIQFGPEVMIVRAPLSTLAHVIFGLFWGYAMARNVGSPRGRFWWLLAGIAAAATVHGLFNLSVFFMPALALLLIILRFFWVTSRFQWAVMISRFRLRRNIPTFRCSNCAGAARRGSPFCQTCGIQDPRGIGSQYCGNCRANNPIDAAYCSSYGDRFVSV
jgi:RsiW-degrading membrane proteinase PrsW (M82 family)